MLKFDPEERITIDEALLHPFFKDLHDPSEEDCLPDKVSIAEFDFEQYDLEAEEFKLLIFDEIKLYNNEEAVKIQMEMYQKYPNGTLYLKYDDSRKFPQAK